MIDIKRAVQPGNFVTFSYYRDGALWYRTGYSDELFPVPIEDIGDAIFLAQDKAILFMRYMRKWNMDNVEEFGHGGDS